MKAKVKAGYRWGVITAFAGCEYVKYEFRNVPPQFESAALVHDALDVMLEEDQEAVAKFVEAGGTVAPANVYFDDTPEVHVKNIASPGDKQIGRKRHEKGG